MILKLRFAIRISHGGFSEVDVLLSLHLTDTLTKSLTYGYINDNDGIGIVSV